MAKSNLGLQKSGQVIAGGRVTANGKVTRAEALAKGDRRGVLRRPRQCNLRRTIRHPHGIVDPEEYYEIRGIIEESELEYKIGWADSPEGRVYEPTWEPKSNVTEAAIRDWEGRKPTSKRDVYCGDTLSTLQSPTSSDLSNDDALSSANKLHRNARSTPSLRDNSPILSGDYSHREVITQAVEGLDHCREEITSQAPGSGLRALSLVQCGPSHNSPCNTKTIHDQHGLPEQHAKEWAAEEEIAPPTTIEGDIETISHDKGLSSQGLELACGILNGCRDETSSKSATEARGSASATSDDAPVPQYRQVDLIDRHSSTYKADILAEITSASSGETPEGLTIPACTQHGDTGNGATTHASENILSDAILRKVFPPIDSESLEITDAHELPSHRASSTEPTVVSKFFKTRPVSKPGVNSDRPSDPSNPPYPLTSGLPKFAICAMLPTMEPKIDTDRRTSSDFFPKSLDFAEKPRQHY